MACEDAMVRIAEASGKQTVVISDRGLLDTKAFMPQEEWQGILNEMGWEEEELSARYDSVVHLMSAAAGAEEFYTAENNAARRESPQEARGQDKLILEAWQGHQGHFVVDNEVDSFRQKVLEVERFVCQRLGLPAPLDSRLSLRVRVEENILQEWLEEAEGGAREFFVDTTFLEQTEGLQGNTFIRRLQEVGSQHLSYLSSTRTVVAGEVGDEVTSTSRRLSKREYRSLKQSSSSDIPPIAMKRRCFVFDGAAYKLDHVASYAQEPVYFLSRMAVRETTGSAATHRLPPFIEVLEDVSGQSLLQMQEGWRAE